MKISKTNTIFVNKLSHGRFLFLFFWETASQKSWIPDKDRSSVLKKQTYFLFKETTLISDVSSSFMPNNETWFHYYLLWFKKTNSLLEKRLWIIKWFFSNTYKEWNYKREKSLKLVPRLHFRCEDTACVCETGWRGHRCEEQDCDPRCSLHGQCKNGTCLCVAGWNGLHCTLEGCPRGCSNHGSCKADFRGIYFDLTSFFCF